MNSDFSDFIRFFPIFRLFPTSRLLDSTPLVITETFSDPNVCTRKGQQGQRKGHVPLKQGWSPVQG